MSNCSCLKCQEPQDVSSVCPPVACSLDAIKGVDDTCTERIITPKPSSLVVGSSESFHVADGSEDDKISLSKVKEVVSGKSVLMLDSNGDLSAIHSNEKTNEGMYLGVRGGKLQLLPLGNNLTMFKDEDIGSSNVGQLAMFACGPNGTTILSRLGLKDCALGVDSNGNIVCRESKVCLTSSSDNVTDSSYLVVLNSDGCLARIPIPTDDKCYALEVSSGKVKIVEKSSSVYFIPSNGSVVLDRSDITATVSTTFSIASQIASYKCYKVAHLLVSATVVGASRLLATGLIKVGGYTLGNLQSEWYKPSVLSATVMVPIAVDGTISYDVVYGGTHRDPVKLKVTLIALS